MYASRWSLGKLRQGDVIGKVFVPAMGTQARAVMKAQRLTDMTEDELPPEDEPYTDVQIPGEWRFVAVVSHDCEFNEDKRNKFLVARLESLPGNLNREQLTALRASNDVEARSKADENVAGVDTFWFDPLPGVFEEDLLASFTTITPFPMRLKDEYVAKKKAELEHEHRLLLRRKLAWFFGGGRGSEDIPDQEKFDAPSVAMPKGVGETPKGAT